MPYYAVKKGKKPGIYETWKECQAQVHGYKGAAFKKFPDRAAALAYIIEETVVRLNSPVFLTKNGYGTMVLMSIEQYSSLTDNVERKLNELLQ